MEGRGEAFPSAGMAREGGKEMNWKVEPVLVGSCSPSLHSQRSAMSVGIIATVIVIITFSPTECVHIFVIIVDLAGIQSNMRVSTSIHFL